MLMRAAVSGSSREALYWMGSPGETVYSPEEVWLPAGAAAITWSSA